MKLSDLKARIVTRAETSTVAEINALIAKEHASRKKSKSYSHKPSNMGYNCLRRLYYEYYRVEPDKVTEPYSIRIMETGNVYEHLIVAWLKKLNKFVPFVPKPGQFAYDEQFVVHSPRWRVKMGKIDAVAPTPEGLWLYEIKSCNDRKFEGLIGPTEDHRVQGAVYIQCYNDLYQLGDFDHMPEIKGTGKALGVRYLYVNKNTSEIKEFVVRYQDFVPTILALDKKMTEVNAYIDRKQLPPCKKSACQYCPYPAKCKSNWNNVDK